MNSCTFMGRLTKDAQDHQGSSVFCSTYTLAVDTGYGEKKETLFLPCIQFKTENLHVYLVKGTKILVRGQLKEKKWTDDEGNEHRAMQLVVQEMEFCESKQKDAEPQAKAPAKQKRYDDEEVPF